jgi:hypothetical protein
MGCGRAENNLESGDVGDEVMDAVISRNVAVLGAGEQGAAGGGRGHSEGRNEGVLSNDGGN